MHLEQASDDTIKVVECGGGQISVADCGEVFIIDAMVGKAHQASDKVVDNGNPGGMYLGDTNVCTNVAARAPIAMWSSISKRGLKHIDGATKDMVVLGVKDFGLMGKRHIGHAIGKALQP